MKETVTRLWRPWIGQYRNVRVFQHDGCNVNHHFRKAARACEAKLARKNQPRLFR